KFASKPHDSVTKWRYDDACAGIAGLIPGGASKGRQQMVESRLAWLIVGAIAGWLAGLIVKGYGFGLIGNIVVGIVGAVIAGWLLPKIGLEVGVGFVAALVNAVIGAVILLVILGLIRR